MRSPRAFTIVELLTALVVLAVGLAAFTRAAGTVARLERNARLQRLVAATLQARLDTLTLLPCGRASSGDTFHDGIRERWRAEPQGRRAVLDLRVDVSARPSLAQHVTSSIPCLP